MPQYDALLIVSFGGPEGRDDVIPFLENVLRGRNVPRERLQEVAEHYYQFGGVSPINAENRKLIAGLQQEFESRGPKLPIYWGNRNWHPMLADTLDKMRSDGVKTALAFVTSAYSSFSSCRQYLEDIEKARAAVGSNAPAVHKIRPYFNHPDFIDAIADNTQAAVDLIPPDRQGTTRILYTGHSIPQSMSDNCAYEQQLEEVARLINERTGFMPSQVVYQSRSGPPSEPWLFPDIKDYLRYLKESTRTTDVVVSPIGFISDHMEVVYDLDTEAKQLCEELGLNMIRAKTAGSNPRFLAMMRELILERIEDTPRRRVGVISPWPDFCKPDCCITPYTESSRGEGISFH